jgi:hypothetical protein
MSSHSHLYTIADDEAVEVLLEKLFKNVSSPQHQEKLKKALDEAAQQYVAATQTERKAFFHGLLTGYAVALKLQSEE